MARCFSLVAQFTLVLNGFSVKIDVNTTNILGMKISDSFFNFLNSVEWE